MPTQDRQGYMNKETMILVKLKYKPLTNNQDEWEEVCNQLTQKNRVAFALRCAKDVAHFGENIPEVAKAINTIELWLEDKATIEEMESAADAVQVAAGVAAAGRWAAHWAARAAAGAAAWAAAGTAAWTARAAWAAWTAEVGTEFEKYQQWFTEALCRQYEEQNGKQ